MRWQRLTAGQGRYRGGGDRPAQLRPYDLPTVIESVKKTNRCVVVEEAWPVASMGSHIAAEIMTHAFDYLDAPVARVNGKDVPMPYAANLEKLALPNVDEVVEAAKAVLYA
jgi:pyruvate dehydrogenase E1 component beta subunit